MSNSRQLRQKFTEILKGFSFTDSFFGKINIKHLNNLDISEISYYTEIALQDALKKGIPSYEEKLDYLIKNNLWDISAEDKINKNKKLIQDFQTNKSNEHLKSKRDLWINEIEKLNKEIKELEIKKSLLINDTAEGFANKKSNELHILYSFYRDKDFKIPLFTNEEFNNLELKETKEIFDIFADYITSFDSQILKRISLSPFFLNMFYLSPENIYHFFGKPIVELTFYQLELWQWASKFRHDLQEFPNIPSDIMSDPDKIIEYVELNQNYNKRFSKTGEQAAGTIVGATKEDLKVLGIENSGNNNLTEALKKSGGKLSMAELLKLQGD